MQARKISPRHKTVTRYWLEFYADRHCTLCGNRGWIDTRGMKTPAGYDVGRLNWCICPNGQELRAQGANLCDFASLAKQS